MSFRINVPWLFHFQTWSESDWRKSGPYIAFCKEGNSLYIGRRMLQLNKSEGKFFLVEACVLGFEIGVTLGAFTDFKMGFATWGTRADWPA